MFDSLVRDNNKIVKDQGPQFSTPVTHRNFFSLVTLTFLIPGPLTKKSDYIKMIFTIRKK